MRFHNLFFLNLSFAFANAQRALLQTEIQVQLCFSRLIPIHVLSWNSLSIYHKSQFEMENTLLCNSLQCRKELTDQAFVTTCRLAYQWGPAALHNVCWRLVCNPVTYFATTVFKSLASSAKATRDAPFAPYSTSGCPKRKTLPSPGWILLKSLKRAFSAAWVPA